MDWRLFNVAVALFVFIVDSLQHPDIETHGRKARMITIQDGAGPMPESATFYTLPG